MAEGAAPARIDMQGLIVDCFAGGGGASTGIEAAMGRIIDHAVNHSGPALAMHEANHPFTIHYKENIWRVVPRRVCGGRRVRLAWFSPDCRHHSKAKGGKPVSKKIRALAWSVVKWARDVSPDVIFLENVEEFQDWGPLLANGKPDKARKGKTFRAWVRKLERYGYVVEWRILVAADYGAPTSRKRLFLVARRDGLPIVWPEPTHGPGRAQPWRTAAEIIDWSIPTKSIFGREKSLAEKTQRRIAAGLRRYVLESGSPFLVKYHGGERGHARSQGLGEPLRTLDTSNRFALVAPTLIQTGYGERKGQAPRVPGLDKPLGTVVAGGQKHALVAAWLAKHFGGQVGQDARRTLGTVTARDHHSLCTATLAPTGIDRRTEVRAFLVKYFGSDGAVESQTQPISEPLHTVTTKSRFGLVTIEGEDYEIVDIGMRMLEPHELFAAQGFPADYNLTPLFNGKPLTKTQRIALAGNSVCPAVAEALVRANMPELSMRRAA